MANQKKIDEHNRQVLKMMLEDSKQETITAKKVSTEENLKTGTREIRSAYFKQWYESCKDVYNKERRRKRKEKRKAGKNNGERN